MATELERPYVQHLRTTGVTAPDTNIIEVHDGEIVVGMNNKFPKLFIKKENGDFEEFVGLSQLLNAEFATQKALSQLNTELQILKETVGEGVPGKSVTEYLLEKFGDFKLL